MTLQQLFTSYLNHVKLFKTDGTYRFYKDCLHLIGKWFEENEITEPSQITEDILLSYVGDMQEKNVSNNSINKRILAVKTCFKTKRIVNEDLQRFPKLKVTDKRFACLTNSEVEKLTNYLDTSKTSLQNKVIIMFLLNTGCRLTELTKIKLNDLILEHNAVLLKHTKNGKERFTLFTQEFKTKYLEPYLEASNLQPNDYLFSKAYSSYEKMFQRIKEQLEFKKFSPHVLRHTFATTLVHNNANLYLIANLLGHANLDTTRRYLHQDIGNTQRLYNQFFKLGSNGENVANA